LSNVGASFVTKEDFFSSFQKLIYSTISKF